MSNLDSVRDWGFAGDYVHSMWTMLQQETPDDYVIATGESHSVREFVEAAFAVVGLADKAVGESRERVRAALHAIGLALPIRINPY